MTRMAKAYLALLGSFWLAGCQTTTPEAKLAVECQLPRPEICTFEYRPVCGLSQSGDWRTEGNGCSACANAAIVGYNQGACDE